MSASPQSVVDSLYSLVQSAQGGFELGNSSNAYQLYTNALNLAGTFAGTGPWAVGINAAATANNTVAAVSAYSTNSLLPSDVLQITGSALALAVAAAAIAGAPVTMSALVLAGTIGIVAGPGPLKDNFNEYATRLGDLMSGGTLGTTPVNALSIASSIGTESAGDVLVVRQYDNGFSESITIEVISKNSASYGEIAHLTGRTATVCSGPLVTVSVAGSVDVPALDSLSTVDMTNATCVSTSVMEISEAQTSSFLSFATGPSATSFSGNSFDFASSAFSSIGLGYESYAGMFASNSLASEYYGLMDWFSHETEWYSQYSDPDAVAYDKLSQLRSIESDVGVSAGHDAREELVLYNGIASPIAIDLNGDGIKTIGSFTSVVDFDITGDGAKERTGWLSGEDGFVAMDRNGNGRVDDATELFGGSERGAGYAELAELDDNNDGVIDAADAAYAALKLWQDANVNGVTDSGELRSLAEASVTVLNLSYTSQEVYDHGNLIGEFSSAVVAGSSTEMADIYFRYRDLPASESATAPTAQEKALSPLGQSVRTLGLKMRLVDELAAEKGSAAALVDRQAQGLVTSLATLGDHSAAAASSGHHWHHPWKSEALSLASPN